MNGRKRRDADGNQKFIRLVWLVVPRTFLDKHSLIKPSNLKCLIVYNPSVYNLVKVCPHRSREWRANGRDFKHRGQGGGSTDASVYFLEHQKSKTTIKTVELKNQLFLLPQL